MRYTSTIGAPTAYNEGNHRGHKASPGDYTIVLKSGTSEANTICTILPNPKYPISAEGYKEYHDFMLSMFVDSARSWLGYESAG